MPARACCGPGAALHPGARGQAAAHLPPGRGLQRCVRNRLPRGGHHRHVPRCGPARARSARGGCWRLRAHQRMTSRLGRSPAHAIMPTHAAACALLSRVLLSRAQLSRALLARALPSRALLSPAPCTLAPLASQTSRRRGFRSMTTSSSSGACGGERAGWEVPAVRAGGWQLACMPEFAHRTPARPQPCLRPAATGPQRRRRVLPQPGHAALRDHGHQELRA